MKIEEEQEKRKKKSGKKEKKEESRKAHLGVKDGWLFEVKFKVVLLDAWRMASRSIHDFNDISSERKFIVIIAVWVSWFVCLN